MSDSFLEFMKGIGIFIVCAQSFLYFTAGKSYEKYIKLLIGVMVLAQFIVPVRNLFLGTQGGTLYEEVERFQSDLEESLQMANLEMQESGFEIKDRNSMKPVEEEISHQLEDKAAEYGYQIMDVELEEEPPKIVIVVMQMKNRNDKVMVSKREIQIGKIAIGQNTGDKKEEAKINEKTKELKEVFAGLLGAESDYVEVVEE